MTKLKFIFILTLFLKQVGFAQNDSFEITRISRTNINYRSYVTVENKLFTINDSGQLIIWDLNKLDTIHFAQNDNAFSYTSIGKDRNNQVYIGTNTGMVYKVNPNDLSISLFLKDKYYVYSICFNSENKLYLVVTYAVYEPTRKKYWNKFENHNGSCIHYSKVLGLFNRRKKPKKGFTMPQYTYLDSKDRWWMCSSFGEFGGDAQIFDTKKEKIYDNKFEGIDNGLFFPKSVFEDNNGNIYITSGLQHFGNSGEIYKIAPDRTVTKIFNSEDFPDTIVNVSVDQSGITTVTAKREQYLFIGPGTYNKNDSCIYFSSTNGFYKANLPSNGKLQKPQRIFNPCLSWGREPLAIGVSMTIKKVEFTIDNKHLFMTTKDGFGIYDGKKLIMLK
jgi:hypothetical protein